MNARPSSPAFACTPVHTRPFTHACARVRARTRAPAFACTRVLMRAGLRVRARAIARVGVRVHVLGR
eukprot:4285557-Alexandrium_andersonii.AAC.1